MAVVILAAFTTDTATAYAILIAAVTTAAATLVGLFQTRSMKVANRPPSDHINLGAVAENTNVIQHVQTHLLANLAGVDLNLPTPAETAAKADGATLESLPDVSGIVPVAPPAPKGP